MPEKELLRGAYDRTAHMYGAARNAGHEQFRASVLAWFADNVKSVGEDVLDVGAGPGFDAVAMTRLGLKPLAIDLSPVMVERCRSQGVAAEIMDFEQLDLGSRRFAGVWAAFSLLHLPKARLPRVVGEIARLLEPGGILSILLFEGEGEGLRQEDTARFGVPRYFAYYRPAELRALVTPSLEVCREMRHENSPRPTLAVCARRPRDLEAAHA